MIDYVIHILILFSIFGILTIALNLLSGFTGLISISSGAFMGIGAYSVGIFMTVFHYNFFAALVVGIIFAMVVGLFLGLIFSQLSGDYFVLATLGFSMIVYGLMQNLEPITRGSLGIPGIGKPAIFGINFYLGINFLLLSLFIFGIVFLFVRFITKSSFGRVIQAIREDETALSIFGYQISHYKLIVFVVSSGLSAIAGGLYASYLTFIDPTAFNLTQSIFIITVVIVGGLASLEGSILASFLLILLPELLRFVGFSVDTAAQLRELLYGLTIVLMMVYRPRGIFGKYKI